MIVPHTHADHWDQYAVELIAKGKADLTCKMIVMLRKCCAAGLPT